MCLLFIYIVDPIIALFYHKKLLLIDRDVLDPSPTDLHYLCVPSILQNIEYLSMVSSECSFPPKKSNTHLHLYVVTKRVQFYPQNLKQAFYHRSSKQPYVLSLCDLYTLLFWTFQTFCSPKSIATSTLSYRVLVFIFLFYSTCSLFMAAPL